MNLKQALHDMAWGSMTMEEFDEFKEYLWNTGVDSALKQAYPVQKEITKKVAERGYGPGDLMPVAYAAKQVCKAVEELAELAGCFHLPKYLAENIATTGRMARSYFDDTEMWPGTYLNDDGASAAELADVLIPLFVCAESLGFDALDEAVQKASTDIQRGVRKE